MATLKVKTETGLEYIYDPRLNEGQYQPTIKVNGLLKANEGGIVAAVANEDYQPPLKVNGLVKGQNNNYSAALENTDYLTPIGGSGLLKNSGIGKPLEIAVAQEDYALPPQLVDVNTIVCYIYSGHFYNIEPTSNSLRIVYSSTSTQEHPNIPSGGFIKPTQATTLKFEGFTSIRGADIDYSDSTPKLEIAANTIWEFSNLQGYLLLKNWSED